MKAIRVHTFGGPEVMKLEELPTPNPGPNEVLIRVQASGVNPYDAYVRSGTYTFKPDLPYTPGIEAAGVVEAIGTNVTDLAPGERVLTVDPVTGTYASHTVAMRKYVFNLPEGVPFEKGVCAVAYATAYRALFDRANVLPGETVLVHGASGNVGVAALQWIRNAGCRVLGTASTDAGKELVLENGAKAVFDHTQAGYIDEIKSAAPHGVDVILEMLANVNLQHDLELLGVGGRVVIVGNRGQITIDPRLTMTKETAILGMFRTNATPTQLRRTYEAIAAGLKSGQLNPLIGRKMPLSEAADAHEYVMHSHPLGKVVLIP